MTEPPQPPDETGPHRPTPGGGRPHDPYPSGGYPQDPYAGQQYPPQQYPPQQYPPQQYPPQQYPPQQYQPGGYPQGGGYPPAASRSFDERLGARLLRRPEPRFGISLAGAAAALVLVGLLIWTFGYLVDGLDINLSDGGDLSTGGGSRRFLGAGLFLVLAVAGYALVLLRRRGPLATTGIVTGAVAVPFTLIFLTFDIENTLSGDLPFNLDAVYIVSVIVWLGSYFFVPGARGRSFLLGASAVGLAGYVGLKAAGDSVARTAFSSVSGDGFDTSGTDSLAAVGLIFGLSYYAIAAFLDKRGHSGAGVAMAYAAFVTTVGGVISAAPSFDQVGTAILLIVLGLALSWYGGFFGRRFTSWAWAVAVVIGVGLLVQKAVPDSYTGAGITFLVIGAVLALAAHAVSATTNEAPDIIEDARAPAPVT
ncbi:MAG: hypothetical protein QOC66_692 [Pseudonocardiales bacterium]|nr:hypothetical protein [Pseudonocardiales bacterium]